MESYFDDLDYAGSLAVGDRLTREEFRSQMAGRIVAGITMWDRDQGRPVGPSPFVPEKRDLRFSWNPFEIRLKSFRDKLEKGDEGYGAVIDYIYDKLDPAYRTQGFVDQADIRNLLRGVLQDGEAGLVFLAPNTVTEFQDKIAYDTRVVRNWMDESIRTALAVQGYDAADINRVLSEMARDDSNEQFIFDSYNYSTDNLVEAATLRFGETDVVPVQPAQAPTGTTARYGQQNQMDIGYLSGDDLRQAFYETGDYNAFEQFVQTQELEWERTYGDLKPEQLANNPDLVIPDRAKFQVWDDRPMPDYQFKDQYNWSEIIRLPFELPPELIASISKKWELSGIYNRYNNGLLPIVTGDAADPAFQLVWRRLAAESFVSDTPMWTFADNALQSRISRVEGMIERFDPTAMDQNIDALFWNILGRRASPSEIIEQRNQIALLDTEITEEELEGGIEQRLSNLVETGPTAPLQTQIAARIQQMYSEEAEQRQFFMSALEFGELGPRASGEMPLDIAATTQQTVASERLGEQTSDFGTLGQSTDDLGKLGE
jgi:hypothetical protein